MSWSVFHEIACQIGSQPVFPQAAYFLDIYYKSMVWVWFSALAPLVL
jgi:hypothetical protein